MATPELSDELTRRQSNTAAVELYLRAHSSEWISATTLAEIGGTLAWRTRVSECRLKHAMHIENMQERSFNLDGTLNVASFYRYLPYGKPLGRDATVPDPAASGLLFSLHPNR